MVYSSLRGREFCCKVVPFVSAFALASFPSLFFTFASASALTSYKDSDLCLSIADLLEAACSLHFTISTKSCLIYFQFRHKIPRIPQACEYLLNPLVLPYRPIYGRNREQSHNQTFTYSLRSSSTPPHRRKLTPGTKPYSKMCQFARIEYTKCQHISKEVFKCKRGRLEPMSCPQAHATQYIRSGQCVGCREAEIDRKMMELDLL
jgi:hypothetical protein